MKYMRLAGVREFPPPPMSKKCAHEKKGGAAIKKALHCTALHCWHANPDQKANHHTKQPESVQCNAFPLPVLVRLRSKFQILLYCAENNPSPRPVRFHILSIRYTHRNFYMMKKAADHPASPARPAHHYIQTLSQIAK